MTTILRRRAASAVVTLACLAAAAACSTSKAAAPSDAGYTTPPLVAARPYKFKEPVGYDPKTPTPLVVVLHGYSIDGLLEQAYLALNALADKKTFLMAYPDGTLDSHGHRYWNATDFCCDLDHRGNDDVAYVGQIIDDMSAQYNVDPKRIYLVGHSNGAFMSQRFACDVAPRIAAVVSLAGGIFFDPAKCQPSEPVAIAEVHGDADAVVNYDGGDMVSLLDGSVVFTGKYPSAHQTVATWAAKNGCTGALAASGPMLDLDQSLAGAETVVERYDGCRASVELWTIKGGSHLPAFSETWPDALWGFLASNAKK